MFIIKSEVVDLAKVYKVKKLGLEFYAVIIGNRLIGTDMSEQYALKRAAIYNAKLRK